jgi:hypothetical protein
MGKNAHHKCVARRLDFKRPRGIDSHDDCAASLGGVAPDRPDFTDAAKVYLQAARQIRGGYILEKKDQAAGTIGKPHERPCRRRELYIDAHGVTVRNRIYIGDLRSSAERAGRDDEDDK